MTGWSLAAPVLALAFVLLVVVVVVVVTALAGGAWSLLAGGVGAVWAHTDRDAASEIRPAVTSRQRPASVFGFVASGCMVQGSDPSDRRNPRGRRVGFRLGLGCSGAVKPARLHGFGTHQGFVRAPSFATSKSFKK